MKSRETIPLRRTDPVPDIRFWLLYLYNEYHLSRYTLEHLINVDGKHRYKKTKFELCR
jgi:hypothetical protein